MNDISAKAHLISLPGELLLEIGTYLESGSDIANLRLMSRRCEWLFFDRMVVCGVRRRAASVQPDRIYAGLFFHATRHDLVRLVQWLSLRRDCLDLRGYIPLPLFEKNKITFLHHALVTDAPRSAGFLIQHGSDINMDEAGSYPDLTPLSLTLARPLTSTVGELNRTLRISCNFGLRKTARTLLIRGADPNTRTAYGFTALQATLVRRVPWYHSAQLRPIRCHLTKGYQGGSDQYWASVIAETVSSLLDFGADTKALTETPRAHKCDHSCWKSLDCSHDGQTALHLAAASGIPRAVSLLLGWGSNPEKPDADGYTPLYSALAQGHEEAALPILSSRQDADKNPIVYIPQRSTALHIACRFAFAKMVRVLLERGSDPNVVNALGQTPLHEVLEQTSLDRVDDVVETLQHLADFGADPAATAPMAAAKCPWTTAASHPFKPVRDMFEEVPLGLYEYLRELDGLPPGAPSPEASTEPTEPASRDQGNWILEKMDLEKHFPVLNNKGRAASSQAAGIPRAPLDWRALPKTPVFGETATNRREPGPGKRVVRLTDSGEFPPLATPGNRKQSPGESSRAPQVPQAVGRPACKIKNAQPMEGFDAWSKSGVTELMPAVLEREAPASRQTKTVTPSGNTTRSWAKTLSLNPVTKSGAVIPRTSPPTALPIKPAPPELGDGRTQDGTVDNKVPRKRKGHRTKGSISNQHVPWSDSPFVMHQVRDRPIAYNILRREEGMGGR